MSFRLAPAVPSSSTYSYRSSLVPGGLVSISLSSGGGAAASAEKLKLSIAMAAELPEFTSAPQENQFRAISPIQAWDDIGHSMLKGRTGSVHVCDTGGGIGSCPAQVRIFANPDVEDESGRAVAVVP